MTHAVNWWLGAQSAGHTGSACEDMFVATPEEQEAGGLAPPKLDDVMATFERDGYVVRVSRSPHPTRRAAAHLLMAQILADVIPHEALDALVSRSDYQAALHVAEGRGPHLDNGLPRM